MKVRPEAWQRLVAEYRSSGETQSDFAQRNGIKASSLRYWLRRLSREAERPGETESLDAQGSVLLQLSVLETEMRGIKALVQEVEGRLERIEDVTQVLDQARQLMSEIQEFSETVADLRQDTILRAEEVSSAEYALKGSPIDDRVISIERVVYQLKNKAFAGFVDAVEKRLEKIEHDINQQALDLFSDLSSKVATNLDEIYDYLSAVSAEAPDVDSASHSFDANSLQEEITPEEKAERQLVDNLLSDPLVSGSFACG